LARHITIWRGSRFRDAEIFATQLLHEFLLIKPSKENVARKNLDKLMKIENTLDSESLQVEKMEAELDPVTAEF
jgi:hypothetical protein